MSARKTEFLVVGGLVLGFVLLGMFQLSASGKTRSAHRNADDAVKRGAMADAERAECDPLDGGRAEAIPWDDSF